MKAYEAVYGFWEEAIMVVLANSEKEVRAIVEKEDPVFKSVIVNELLADLDKPGIIFTYNR